MSDRAFKILVWVTAILLCVVFWVQVGMFVIRLYTEKMDNLTSEVKKLNKSVEHSIAQYEELLERGEEDEQD